MRGWFIWATGGGGTNWVARVAGGLFLVRAGVFRLLVRLGCRRMLMSGMFRGIYRLVDLYYLIVQ